MGTGVPSSQLTPTVFFSRKTFVIITPLRYYVKKKIGDPWENRTPVYGVRGRRLSRLTNGPFPHTVFIGVQKEVVHHRGLEPRTHWLRVSCSTIWANGAFRQLFLVSFALSAPSKLNSNTRDRSFFRVYPNHNSGQALDLLVSVRYIHYCTSTPDLSTTSSTWGLTSEEWEILSYGEFHA